MKKQRSFLSDDKKLSSTGVIIIIMGFIIYLASLVISALLLSTSGFLETIHPPNRWIPVLLVAILITFLCFLIRFLGIRWLRKRD